MVETYHILAERVNYPLHLGVTHAGTAFMGTIKNAIAMGTLIQEGIGATIRVSLTAPPEEEVKAGWAILKAVGARQRGPELISCPTCGRTEINLFELVAKVENIIKDIDKPIKVAVMGCAVNGPGEAMEADIGIAGGKKAGAIFLKGKVVRTVKEEELIGAFVEELKKII
jgi:(E)-4-hydroxy-3-methylbut-2-enyl-diphosphate synthase